MRVKYKVAGEIFDLLSHYRPTRILGQGAYAVVCEAQDLRTGQFVAIKKNTNVFQDAADAKRILREIKLLMHFDHADVVGLIDVIPPKCVNSFTDCYLVLQYMECNLRKVIRSGQQLSNRHLQFFLYQLLRGLKYIHSTGVIHRDLKPENILINAGDCNLKIADFGLARGVHNESSALTEYVVTRWYRAPEIICSHSEYDMSVDLWAVGCIFGECITSAPLFPGRDYLEQLQLIFNLMGTPKMHEDDWLKSADAKRWVRSLPNNPGMDLEQVFSSATRPAVDLLKRLLVLDPRKRISAAEGIQHPWLVNSGITHGQDEPDGALFDPGHDFESRIATPFGIRHLMFEELTNYHRTKKSTRRIPIRQEHIISPRKSSEVTQPMSAPATRTDYGEQTETDNVGTPVGARPRQCDTNNISAPGSSNEHPTERPGHTQTRSNKEPVTPTFKTPTRITPKTPLF